MKHPSLPTLCSTLVLCLCLAACQKSPQDAGGLQAAKEASARRDFKSAIVIAKSALQKNGDDADARQVLGQALFETGDARSATVEFRKSLELGQPDAQVLPWLARSLLAQGEAREVVQRFQETRLTDASASADLKVTVATAHAALGARNMALETAQAALREAPQHAGATLLLARLKAADGDVQAAMTLIDQVVAADARNVDALTLRADLQRGDAKLRDAALASYQQALAVQPDAVPAYLGLISLLIDQRKFDDAKAQLAKLQTVAPQRADALLLEAQLALLTQDYGHARDVAALLLKSWPDNPRLLQIAGTAELQLNSLAAAENYFNQAVKLVPDAPAPRQMLARVMLRGGQGQRVLELLQPLMKGQSTDPITLTLAGQAALMEGEPAKAEDYFARAAAIDPNNPGSRTALALSRLAKGNGGNTAELETAAAADSGISADLAIIAVKLRADDPKGALKAIDALQKKEPNKPLAHLLRGRVQLRMKDSGAATASFEQALKIDPSYFPATAALASMDMQASRPDVARQRFETLIKADPKNHRALMALAELEARSGGSKDKVVKQINEAVRVNPGDPGARIVLVRYLQSQGDVKGALAAAQDAEAATPDNADVLELLGATQLAAGQAQQALSTYNKLAALRPGRAENDLRLADAYIALKQYDAARRSLERVLSAKRGFAPAQIALGRLEMLAGRDAEALQVAKTLQRNDPKSPAGYLLQADLAFARDRPADAIEPLRAALQLNGGPQAAIYLHRAFVASDNAAQAERLAASWIKEHPKDVAMQYYLGDQALARKDYRAAEDHYRAVLALRPDHALALNNVAWLMTQQNKPGAAALAERANQLLPQRTSLMDTLAWALANEQQSARAIEVQKKAVAQEPDNASLKLTLAKIYLKAGNRDQARTELNELAKLGDKFSGQAEVAALIKAM